MALAAIALWASLATLANELSNLPPFLLTGIGLLIGSLISLPLSRFRFYGWKLPWKTLVVGVYGLFGYHFLLFLAFQSAPAVEANLVNYLWPLLIVVLSPLILRGTKLTALHVLASVAGFAGAFMAITAGSEGGSSSNGFQLGYLFALGAAVVWASYSLLTRRVPHFPTSAIGIFGAISGVLALIAHLIFESPVALNWSDARLLILLGIGPLGGAFYLWDAALKTGDPRRIGILAFTTPLLSTVLLLATSGRQLSWQLALATLLIVGAASLGSVAGKSELKSRQRN